MELLMNRVPREERTPEAAEIATLVQQTLAGDSEAFEKLVFRYERRVLNLSMRLLQTIPDAQDAAQEVFLRAFRYLHRLDVRKPVEPWLIRITVNVCRDMARKRQRNHQPFTDSLPEEAGDPSLDPCSTYIQRQRKRMLWRALEGLPEKERMALVLRDVEGFSTSEVAEILGSSESTVRSQICRGRLRIKEAMDVLTGGQS